VTELSALKYLLMQKIKWLCHHTPTKLFSKTADEFQKHLSDLTNNKYEIEIVKSPESKPIDELKHGRAHMSQITSNQLGKYGATDFYALILPYLFSSTGHAERVLSGEIGDKLLTHLHERTGICGLAFGWMEITQRFDNRMSFPRWYPSGWWNQIMTAGFKEHNPIMNDMTDLFMSNILNTADTKHSTYLTTIVANNEFIETLPDQDKEHFTEAARRTASTQQKSDTWPGDNIEKLRKPWEPLYEKYRNFFTFDIIDQIKKHPH